MSNISSYDDDSIQTLTGLQPYRLRPQGYLKDLSIIGQCHLVYELISNSFDESIQALLENKTDGEYELFFFRNTKKNRYAILSRDTYRGIPLNKLHDAMLVGNTSGKYNTNVYGFAAGLYGVALKLCCALSKSLIAFSYRDKKSRNIRVYDAEETTINNKLYTNTYNPNRTGLDIYYEIDPSFFFDINDMVQIGYTLLKDIIIKISIFFPNNKCKMYLIEDLLYDDLTNLDCDPNIFQEKVDKIKNSKLCSTLLDTSTFSHDPLKYLEVIWNITSKVIWSMHLQSNTDDKIKFDIYTINTKDLPIKTVFYSVINNVLMERIDSSHVKVYLNLLKTKLTQFIDPNNKDLIEFFMVSYRLPIYFAISVLYSGASYQGFAKESFHDRNFEHKYNTLLNEVMNEIDIHEYENLFKTFEKDLLLKFSNLTKKYTENKTFNTLLTVLNKPQNFYDCSIKDRSLAELFLVEGGSAGASMVERDSITQAYLLLQGKPINVVKGIGKEDQSIKLLQDNAIMQDLCKILGLKPGQTDFEKLNFGSIFLFQDADSDGRHIRELLIGNLYHICPKIINSGMVHLVIPPLYRISSKSNPNKKFFVKDSDTFLNIKIDYIFKQAFELGITGKNTFKKYTQLTDDLYTSCCYIIDKVGKTFDIVSSLTLIPSNVLEGLVQVYDYLSPDNINIDKIKYALQLDKVEYNKSTHSITISIKNQDLVINLIGVMEEINNKIFPLLNELHWDKYQIYLTTLNNLKLYNKTPLSITTLYQIFEKTNELFYIERLKGLGSMKPNEAKITCLDKDTRITYPIKSVGDIDLIYNLLGDSPNTRKELLNSLNLIVAS